MEDNRLLIVQKTWLYVSKLRKKYWHDICTDPEIDFQNNIIKYIVQPKSIFENQYEIRLSDGMIRNKENYKNAQWSDWRVDNFNVIEDLLIEYE